MKITEVRTIPLSGGTHDTGWPGGKEPDEQMNTLVEVMTDEGLAGIGSCFTSQALVEAALQLLRPMLIGETGLEPERVTEKLRQMTFWQGRGGAVEHAISGIDIALWDLLGKALGQPVSRLLGGNYRDRIKPYGSILFDEPPVLRGQASGPGRPRGFRAIKMGWRPFGRVSRKLDELLVRTARETVGDDVELMVDAGGSEQFWPHGFKWARETAKMLADYDVVWFEEALPPGRPRGLHRAAPDLARARSRPARCSRAGRPSSPSSPSARWTSSSPTAPSAAACRSRGASPGWRYDHNVLLVPHGWNTGIGLAADLALSRRDAGRALGRVPDRRAVHRGDHRPAVPARRRRACSGSPPAPASASG